MKKVLYCITKSNWGGAQRHVYDLAVAAAQQGFSVAVAAGGNGLMFARLHDAGVRTIAVPALDRDVSFGKDLRASVALARIMLRERPDVVHLHSSKMGLFGALAARITRVPHIIFTAHGWPFNDDMSPLMRSIYRVLMWCTVWASHTTIAVSAATRAELHIPYAKKKIRVVHNGIDAPRFVSRTEARARLISACPTLARYSDDPWIVSVGELRPGKRHRVMIEAMRSLALQLPHVRYVVIGQGEERARLEEQIRKTSLGDHVFLCGEIPDASSLLHAADIFVQPSARAEALPYTIIEALFAGLPIVATRVAGVSEIIQHERSGILVPYDDPEALTNALRMLCEQPSMRERYAHAAQERAGQFRKERMIEKILHLYSEV